MGQRQGTILKKYNARQPGSLRPHVYATVLADGRQRELSFTDELEGIGRCWYGSGRQLAKTRS